MRTANCKPLSWPVLPTTHNHPLWEVSLFCIYLCTLRACFACFANLFCVLYFAYFLILFLNRMLLNFFFRSGVGHGRGLLLVTAASHSCGHGLFLFSIKFLKLMFNLSVFFSFFFFSLSAGGFFLGRVPALPFFLGPAHGV